MFKFNLKLLVFQQHVSYIRSLSFCSAEDIWRLLSSNCKYFTNDQKELLDLTEIFYNYISGKCWLCPKESNV